MEDMKQDSSVAEKIFMLIYRYRPDDNGSKDGQIYFMMTSAEKDKMFRNVMERLRKDKEAQKIFKCVE